MVSPSSFGFNEEAFLSNKFQEKSEDNYLETQEKAKIEFDTAVEKLKSLHIKIIVSHNSKTKNLPDEIFPNNWISTHQNGFLITYPMFVSNRRAERNNELVSRLCKEKKYTHLDYSNYENKQQYLEGTGSIIFDHKNKKAYACESPRTSVALFKKVVENLGYTPVTFKAYGREKELIYHTNVMLTIGEDFILIGSKTIQNEDRERVLNSFVGSGKKIIELSNEQVYNSFAGNMLQVENNKGERILVLSETAYKSLNEDQVKVLKKYNQLFCVLVIPTIEKIGGGSARCMLAEIF